MACVLVIQTLEVEVEDSEVCSHNNTPKQNPSKTVVELYWTPQYPALSVWPGDFQGKMT